MFKRTLLVPLEALAYGPVSAGLQYLIRSPQSLEAGRIWHRITSPKPSVFNFIAEHWPLRSFRWQMHKPG
ncbi:MAG: hypothetical protein MI725_11435 [Pirellulales bacterium]|nr:hypothetical protein [Pirellulales bacterium]